MGDHERRKEMLALRALRQEKAKVSRNEASMAAMLRNEIRAHQAFKSKELKELADERKEEAKLKHTFARKIALIHERSHAMNAHFHNEIKRLRVELKRKQKHVHAELRRARYRLKHERRLERRREGRRARAFIALKIEWAAKLRRMKRLLRLQKQQAEEQFNTVLEKKTK